MSDETEEEEYGGENEKAEGFEEELEYEADPQTATGFGKEGESPGIFNRKRVLMALCVTLAAALGSALVFNLYSGDKKKNSSLASQPAPGKPPSGFLQNQLDRAQREHAAEEETESSPPLEADKTPPALPSASWNDNSSRPYAPPPPSPAPAPPPPRRGGSTQTAQEPTYYKSPLVPRVEGSIIAARGSGGQEGDIIGGNQAADEYLRFLSSREAALNSGGDSFAENAQAGGGSFTEDNALWPGTIIPAVLITSINTALGGNVLARSSENIYDSRTGKSLLIPQGTILFARYNDSVSYAQSRVQIAWDTLIRPDGFQLDLGGMGGVDRRGMSGQEAEYNENWFEYLKAAGLIALFSTANARMTGEAAKHASDAVAGNIAQSNAEFMSQIGSSIVSRAMGIQPHLTVDSGESVAVMINRSIYLPPLRDFPVTGRYRLE